MIDMNDYHNSINDEDYKQILDGHLVSDIMDEMKEQLGADELLNDLFYAVGKIEMFKALRYIKRVKDMHLECYSENDD